MNNVHSQFSGIKGEIPESLNFDNLNALPLRIGNSLTKNRNLKHVAYGVLNLKLTSQNALSDKKHRTSILTSTA